MMYVSKQKPRLEAAKVHASVSPRRIDASPRSQWHLKLRYDIIIHNFHPFNFFIYVFKTFKTKLHMCIRQCFQMQAKRVRCDVLPHEFSLIHLHGFLTALHRPRLGLILSCLASHWTRQCCLGLGLVKTASPTSLKISSLHSSSDI